MNSTVGRAVQRAQDCAAQMHRQPAERDETAPEGRGRAKCVLVALDERHPHVGAIDMARLIARALHAPLHGLFIGRAPIAASEVPACVGVSPEALRGVVLEVAACDDPVEALAAATEGGGASFVVVASEPEDVAREPLGIGRLAAHAVTTAAYGAIVVPEETRAPALHRILLPLDGAPSTAAAIAPVGELARRLDAELDIVTVGCASGWGAGSAAPRAPGPAWLEPGAMSPPRYVDQPHHEWAAFTEEFVHRFLNAIGHCPPGVATRFFLGAGEPAAEILRMARALQSDLVVLVWHGQLDERHGRVFREVLRDAPCPTLVLRR